MSIINRLLQLRNKPSQKQILELLSWSKQNANIIEPLDSINYDINKLNKLDKLLENKRVVYLGEEDHWIHEKTVYRIIMLRYLISRGWNYIGEEIGWSDGIRIGKYIDNGQESYLEKIATYGYTGALRTDREDKPQGILKSSSDNYPLAEFKSEQLFLTKTLKEINFKKKKIRIESTFLALILTQLQAVDMKMQKYC